MKSELDIRFAGKRFARQVLVAAVCEGHEVTAARHLVQHLADRYRDVLGNDAAYRAAVQDVQEAQRAVLKDSL